MEDENTMMTENLKANSVPLPAERTDRGIFNYQNDMPIFSVDMGFSEENFFPKWSLIIEMK